jgi:hypothetical protein
MENPASNGCSHLGTRTGCEVGGGCKLPRASVLNPSWPKLTSRGAVVHPRLVSSTS